MGDLCLESLIEFIQTQDFRHDNGNIFMQVKMCQRSRFVCRVMKTQNVLTHSINLAIAPHIWPSISVMIRQGSLTVPDVFFGKPFLVRCALIPGVTIDDISLAMLPGDFHTLHDDIKILLLSTRMINLIHLLKFNRTYQNGLKLSDEQE